MISNTVRVLRVLEYVGPAEWVEQSLQKRAVKESQHCGDGKIIREAVLGDYPERLPRGGTVDHLDAIINKALTGEALSASDHDMLVILRNDLAKSGDL